MLCKHFPLFFIVLLLSACSTASKAATAVSLPPDGTYDISFIGVPFKASPIAEGSGADAIEIRPDGNTDYSAVVLLSVERELKGSLPEISSGGPSKIDQAGDALKNKQFLKVLLMDFEDPDAVQAKAWASVAVVDPVKTFGIRKESESGKGQRYRVYFRNTTQGYHMIAAVPAS